MLVFFFQAEDGIRDGHVTGVQTCALPISRNCAAPDISSFCRTTTDLRTAAPPWRPSRLNWTKKVCAPASRSEERRVGKECRSRWWRHHLKKKAIVSGACGWSTTPVKDTFSWTSRSIPWKRSFLLSKMGTGQCKYISAHFLLRSKRSLPSHT